MLTGRELDDLIRTLDREGFEVGASQRADLFELCTAQARRLHDPGRIDAAALLLAPVVCRRARDQARFHDVYEDWARTADRVAEQAPPPPKTPHPPHSPRSDRPLPAPVVWALGCLATALTLAVALTLVDPLSRDSIHARTSAPRSPLAASPQAREGLQLAERSGLGSLRLMGLFVPMLVFGFWLHWRTTRRKAVANRFRTHAPDDLQWLRPAWGDLRPLYDPTLARETARFRAWEARGPARVDVPATVEATAAAAGRVVLVSGATEVPRELVALVQSAGPEDHAARLARSLLELLRQDEVRVHTFGFEDEPGTVRPEGSRPDSPAMRREGLELELVRKRHPASPVLVFGDSVAFFDAERDRVRPWVTLLTETRRCFLLSYTPERRWGWRERALEAAGVTVLPLSLAGLMAIPRWLEPGEHRREAAPGPVETQAGGGEEAPVSTDRCLEPGWQGEPAELRTTLEARFDPATLHWLAACAVFPHLRWEITVTLGARLADAAGKRLITEGRLREIVALPWFRTAAIPDDARLALIETLSPAARDHVRSVVRGLMLDSLGTRGPADEHSAPSPRQDRPADSRLLEDYVATRPAGSPVRDRIFTAALFGRGRHLALEWSERLAKLLGFGVDIIPLVGIALALLGMLGIHVLLGAVEGGMPALDRWLREHEPIVLGAVYVAFVASWCAFWTAVIVNSRFVVRFEEFRKPRFL